jgi:hypothetical protein
VGNSSLKESLDSELPFQRKQWRNERIGWAAMTVLILYALAGGLGGGGPLSNAEAVAVDGSAHVRYEKLARQLAPTSIDISVTQPPDGRPAQIHVSASYLSSMTVRSIVPEPDAMTVADNGYVFVFKRLSGVTDSKIHLQLEPQQMGAAKGWLVINNGEKLAIKQFVFP